MVKRTPCTRNQYRRSKQRLTENEMSEFRHLPRDQEYSCRECSKTDFGNYFASATLCKKCAAKRRVPTARAASTLIEHEPGQPAMTTYVKKRLQKQAETESMNQHPEFTVPYTKLEQVVYSDFFKTMLLGHFVRRYFWGVCGSPDHLFSCWFGRRL